MFAGDAVSALVPTGQQAGETTANTAQTAPGGDSGSPARPAPVVATTAHDQRPTVTDGQEPRNPAPYNNAAGDAWSETDASDDIITGQSRPSIRLGRWNQV